MMKIYRTQDKQLTRVDDMSEGTWICLTSPTDDEVRRVAATLDIETADIVAATDPEESARISLEDGYTVIIVDIPIKVEGASEGVGLGHDFLRHVERCRLLLHVVDVSGSECRDPIEDFEKINEELAKFSPVLAERPQIVVGNKCDLATEEQIETFRQYVEGKGLTFVPISAATMQGVKQLPGLVYNRLKDIPQVPVFTPEYKKPEPKKNGRDFTIQRMEAHVWSVDAPWLEYILAGSNVDDYESLQFFQRQLGESGILDALVQKGVEENDTILIGEYQFDYIF